MTKLESDNLGSDGASTSTYTLECIIRGWRARLHADKSLRRNAVTRLIRAGQSPDALRVFMNRKGLEKVVLPKDLATFGEIVGFDPDRIEFKISDHKVNTEEWDNL